MYFVALLMKKAKFQNPASVMFSFDHGYVHVDQAHLFRK